jgi:S-layer domain protein
MNNIYKVIWSKVANALVVVSELARSKGVSGRNSVAASSNTVKVRTKLTALSVALSFCFGASSVFAADATYDNVTVNTSLAVNGTATVNGKTIATTDTVNNAVAGKLDTSTFTTFQHAINPRVTNLENNKLDTSAFNAFKSGDFTTWQTKVNNKLDTSTFSTFRDGINPRVTNLENNKLNKTDFTTFQSTVNGQITNLTNTKLNTATFNQFNTNLTGLVNQVLGTAFTVAQMQGTFPAYTYTGIKYFRANSTGVDASATGTDAVAIGPVAQATEVDTVAIGHEASASKAAAIAVGKKSYSNADNGVAVGNDSTVTAGAKSAVALGFHARAGSNNNGDVTYDGASTFVPNDGASAVAIGDHAISRGQHNIAIGKNALTTNKDKAGAFSQDSVAIGSGAETIAASSAIALGKGARVGVRGSNAGADSAIAIGDQANATGLDATAIGHSAQAGKSGLAAGSNANAAGVNSVALGNAAQTTTEGAVAIGDRAYAAPWRTISIGQDAGKGQATDTVGDKNEQINIGVRSGENVDGQLNIGIGQAAGSNVKGKGNIALGQNAGQYIGGTNSSVGNNISIGTNANQYTTPTDIIESVAIGFNSQAGTRAMSLGVKTKATADGSVAIGNSAQANGAGSMAIGKDSVVNGADNVALGRSSIANTDLKQGYLTSTASSTVVSVGKSDLLRRVVNVADGADDQDAATVAQLKKVSDDVYNKVSTQINNLHIAAATGINYDVIPRTATENSVTLSKNGKKTIIGSVADGVLDDDAVNVSQLNREIDKKTTHYFSVNQGGTTTLGNFNNNGAVGAKSLAIGMDVRTAGERGVALGNSTSAEAFGSIAIGALYDGSNALDDNDPQAAKQTVTKSSPTQPFKYNMAIGAGAASEGNNAIAIGTLAKTTTKQQNVVSPDRAVALGYYAASSAEKANAIGERATATEAKANAFGSQAYAGGVSATAIGSAASASGTNSIAMGSNQRVTAANSGSIGYAGDLTLNTTGRDLAGTYATNATRVSGTGTYSIGNTNSNVTSNESGVFGNNNVVQGIENIRVMGNNNTITQNNQNPQGGAAVAPTLKNVYVTGHANKIDTGTKPLEASKNIFVMGAGNIIGDSSTAKKITDTYVIGTGNKVSESNELTTTDDPSDPAATKTKIGKGYFILGNNVNATLQNSVYLGTNSAFIEDATKSAKEKYPTTQGSDYDKLLASKYSGLNAVGVVTIGNGGDANANKPSEERRLQGVAAGLVAKTSTDAINGSQLYAHTRPLGFAADNTAGLNANNIDGLAVDDASITNMAKRAAGQAIKLNGGADKTKLSDNNIGTLVKGTNQVDIKLAKELKGLTSAEFTDGTNTTTINGKGVTINNGPSMTTAGINAGNQKITNVAAGDADTDAVNVSQLKAARTVVKSDDHSVLVQKTEDGLTNTYDVSVAMPVVYTKADGTKVYKLADGTFNTDANGGAATKVEAADVIASMHNAAGSTTTAIALANVASSIQNKAGANFAEKLNAANTANPNNAVNVSDLKLTKDSITNSTQGGGFGLADDGNTAVTQDLGKTIQVKGSDGITTTANATDKTLTLGLAGKVVVNPKDGNDGSLVVKGKDGKDGTTITKDAIVFNGVDGVNGKNGADGKDGQASLKVVKGAAGLDGNDGKDGVSKTRIVYEKPNGEKEEVATLNDGLKFGANAGTVHNAKLNTQVDVKGAAANADWTKFDAGKNIMTNIDGNTITVGLAKDLDVNSVTTGDTKVENSGITIKNGSEQSKTVSLTKTGLNNGGNQVVNMDSGLKDSQGNKVTLTEATGDVLNNGVNVGDLKETVNKLIGPSDIGGFGLKDKAGNEFKQSLGTTAQITGDKNINTKVVDVLDAQGQPTGKKALEVGLNPEVELGKKGNDGVDGKLTVNGKDGSAVVINGKDGSIGLNGKDGENGLTMKSANGKDGVDGANGTNGKTRIVYELKDKDGKPVKGADGKPVTEEVATLNDGLVFAGNNTDKVNKHKLNSKVNIVGDSTADELKDFKSATGNLNVVADGNDKLTVQMSKNLKNLNSVALENPTDTTKSVTLNVTDKGELNVGGNTTDGNQVTGVKSSITDKAGATFADKLKNAADKDNGNPNNAVNVGDLYNVFSGESGGGFGLKDKAGNEFKQDLGTTAQITGDKNINTKVVDVLDAQGQATGKKALEVGLNPEIELGEKAVPGVNGQPGKDGVDGKIGVNGKDGSAVVINGKDGSIGLNGKDGKDGLTMKSAQGKPGVDGKDGETKTRIVYETKDKDGKPVTEEVATLNDGLKFGDNSGNVHNAKLNSQVNVKGAETNKDWGKFDGGKNIMTQIKGNTITVGLANDINVNSVTTNKVTVGDTTITTDGVTINNGPSMTKSGGINANNTTIKNVAPGVNSTDAVNVSQLRAVEGKLNRADKHLRAGIAGANAAAGLPQAYLPGKSMVAVSAGTYRGEGAVALGMSRISDNGKVVVKITGNSDTRGNLGASLGAGYQW